MKFPKWLKIYGDLDWRGKCPTESAEQITLINWLRLNGYVTAIHPRNEGKRNYYQAAKHKAEGMTKGAADIIIPGRITFVCELKRRDHTQSRWEEDQQPYLEQCHKDGAFVCVALGHSSAIEAVKEWIELNKQGK